METLANLEAFVRSAEASSFSGAARRLSITPAAVSRNVAMLERNLGIRLFHRSTRKLTLTNEEVSTGKHRRQPEQPSGAIDGASQTKGEPVRRLKLGVRLTFAMGYVSYRTARLSGPLSGRQPDWHFDSRKVDLIAEGFDAAIGGGFELLNPGIVPQTLRTGSRYRGRIAGYFADRREFRPADLADHAGILMRSSNSGRIRQWMMRDAQGREERALHNETIVMSDAAPMAQAAIAGLGIALLAVPDVLEHMESGALERILPKWYADAGSISLYYSGRVLQPLKTRAFIDFYTEYFRSERLSARFAGSLR